MFIKFEIPKFDPEKDDAELWLYRYEKASKLNNWSKEIRLNYVDNCFNYEMQLWYVRNKFTNLEKFKSSFLQNYSKKIDIDKLVVQIISIKMSPHEGIHHYFNRFELLRNQYVKESMKRDIKTKTNVFDAPSQVPRTDPSSSKETEPVTQQENKEEEDNFILIEKGFN